MKTIAHKSEPKLLKKILNTLRKLPSYSSIEFELLEQVLASAESVYLDKDDILLKDGDKQSNILYILIKGLLSVEKDSTEIATLSSPGKLVGELSVLTAGSRTADVIAKKETHVVAIDSSFLNDESDSQFRFAYLKVLSTILAEKLMATTEKAKLYEDAVFEANQAEELSEQLKEELQQRLFQIKLYSQVVESNQDAIFVCGQNGIMKECNQAFCELLGYKQSQLDGLNIHDVIDHLFASGKRKLTSIEETGWHGERNIIKADGEIFPGLITISPVISNKTKQYAVNIRDISLQREYEDSLLEKNRELRSTYQVLEETVYELEKSNQFKNRFFSNVTSQLKTPLISIQTLSELLRKMSANREIAKYVDNIVSEQQKLEQMVDNILVMTEVNKDLTDLNLSVFHIQDLLGKALDNKILYLNKSQHSLMADKAKLKKALRECVHYLAKSSKNADSEVVVYHYYDKNRAAHHIIFSHKVLVKAQVKALQSEESQIVEDIEGQIQDAELHLPLVKRIIEIHNGQFNLFQKNGQAVIKVVLPSEPEQGLAQTPTVMIIDDDLESRKQYAHIIQGLFETVTLFEFTDQVKAMNSMNTLNPDVIIIDPKFEKAEWDYDEYLNKILEHKPEASIVFVITNELKTPEHRNKILALDIKEFLGKPFNEADLEFRLNQLFSTHQQITVMSKNINKALESAFTDGLTGLFNRRYYDKFVEEAFMKAQIQGHVCSVILLDVDNFKHYNDTNGHQFGDEVLSSVGELLKNNTRQDDMPARYGGEEFVVVLPHTSKSMAKVFADKIRKSIEKQTFPKEASQPLGMVTASFGVASFPEDGQTVHEVVERADNALYEAKESGRNRVVTAGKKKTKK